MVAMRHSIIPMRPRSSAGMRPARTSEDLPDPESPTSGRKRVVDKRAEEFIDLAIAELEEQERILGFECEEAAKGRLARRQDADVFRW